MNLFFTLWNVELQDNGYDIAVGDRFIDNLNIEIIDNLNSFITKRKTQFSHIKDNIYNISCYVYNIIEDIAFVEIQGLYFMIDFQKDLKLEIDTYYNFIGEIYHDQWNNLCLNPKDLYEKYYKEFEINGFIKSIAYNTALLIKINDNHYSAVGVEPKFDYKIEKSTNCGWGEKELYPHTGGSYLVEIEIDNIDIQRKRLMETFRNIFFKKIAITKK